MVKLTDYLQFLENEVNNTHPSNFERMYKLNESIKMVNEFFQDLQDSQDKINADATYNP